MPVRVNDKCGVNIHYAIQSKDFSDKNYKFL